jgi:hypothetical protein
VEIVVAKAVINTNGLLASEALYLGAPLAHVAAFNERRRLARIASLNRAALRHRRVGAFA